MRFRKEKRGKNMSDLVRVAVDAMGGDYAPVEPVKGAVEAVNADERVKDQTERLIYDIAEEC